MLLYAITDGSSCAGNFALRLDLLVRQAARWAAAGVDLIQVREKDLPAGKLAELTRKIVAAVAETKGNTRVLLNARADIAIAAGADGVHLTAAAGELTPEQVRQVFRHAGRPSPSLSVSCHTLEEVRRASGSGVDAILFSPVFGKSVSPKLGDKIEILPATGLERLREACRAAGHAQVFALGGVTEDLAPECLQAGAAGVAGIRLFQNFPHR